MKENSRKIFVALIFILSCCIYSTSDGQEVRFEKFQTLAQSIHVPDTITLCFTGDMMMHSRQMEFDFRSYFNKIGYLFREADIAVANMEFTLAGEPYTGYPQFSAPDTYATYIAESGINLFLCANNHILDKGCEGAERTLQRYRELSESHDIRFTGAAGSDQELQETTPIIIEKDGIKIAFINFTYGTNLGRDALWPRINYQNQKEFLKSALCKAERSADFTVVLPHWGEEYRLTHSEDQENIARWLIENGADLIIGTHPHVVQDIAYIDGIAVAYSLGNCVSNMSAPNTQIGLTITATLVTEINGRLKLHSLDPIHTWCSRPGGYGSSYIVLPVDEQIGKRDEWIGGWEYDKMVSTYENIRKTHNK